VKVEGPGIAIDKSEEELNACNCLMLVELNLYSPEFLANSDNQKVGGSHPRPQPSF